MRLPQCRLRCLSKNLLGETMGSEFKKNTILVKLGFEYSGGLKNKNLNNLNTFISDTAWKKMARGRLYYSNLKNLELKCF